jgi:murein DD-endopeptidase MepM/ murein hydrolase activator NlpD
MDDIKNNSIPAVPIKKEKPTQPTIKPTDPRSYQNKKLDDSIIWPIKAVDLSYVTGKINNVLLVAKNKETVSAIKGGLVIFSGLYRGFGQVVFVHAQNTGHIYVYSGLDTISVKKGQKVTFGDEIGTLGIDSITNKPTLNFMVFKNGEPVDPAKAPRG